MPSEAIPFSLSPNLAKVCIGLIDVVRSNPNGDPARQGSPKVDPWGHGRVSHGKLRRMCRDYALEFYKVDLAVHPDVPMDDMYAQFETTKSLLAAKWDSRVFGDAAPGKKFKSKATGTFGLNAAMSIDPVSIEQGDLTRCTGYKKAKGNDEDDDEIGASMGSSPFVEYGLYRTNSPIHAINAKRNGTTEEDLLIAVEALLYGWDYDRAANRPHVDLRRLFLFEYPSHRFLPGAASVNRWVQVVKRPGIFDPSSFEDYDITVDTSQMSPGMVLHEWADGRWIDQARMAAK